MLFKSEASRLKGKLGINVRIDHFGSSAVPNLGGKGIIDIFITTKKDKITLISKILQEKLGYDFRPDGGDEQRLFFWRCQKDNNDIQRTYHVHLTDAENQNYKQTIALRDYLRAHPQDAKRYDDVKKQASELAMKSNDYEEQKKIYQKSKSNLIEELNHKSLNWHKS